MLHRCTSRTIQPPGHRNVPGPYSACSRRPPFLTSAAGRYWRVWPSARSRRRRTVGGGAHGWHAGPGCTTPGHRDTPAPRQMVPALSSPWSGILGPGVADESHLVGGTNRCREPPAPAPALEGGSPDLGPAKAPTEARRRSHGGDHGGFGSAEPPEGAGQAAAPPQGPARARHRGR